MLRVLAILVFALHALLPVGIRLTVWCAPCATACCTESGESCCGSACDGCSCCVQRAESDCCGECAAPVDTACGNCECMGAAECAVSLLMGDCRQCCCCTQVGDPASGAIAEKNNDLKRLLGFDAEDLGVEPFHAAFITVAKWREPTPPSEPDRPPDPRRRQARLCIWTI